MHGHPHDRLQGLFDDSEVIIITGHNSLLTGTDHSLLVQTAKKGPKNPVFQGFSSVSSK
jgi:hypothetical protein